jgi:hypothetical protein
MRDKLGAFSAPIGSPSALALSPGEQATRAASSLPEAGFESKARVPKDAALWPADALRT